MKEKKILIINTGGTISSIPTQNGLAPATGYVEAALANLAVLQQPEMPDFNVIESNPLIDSANIGISDWNQLVLDIEKAYNEVDGFIIFHGTDTMAYTASALSFMLKNLGKPVILTGSLVPLSAVRNDAVGNIVTSLLLCSNYPIYEVCIYFNQHLLRGNRARKLHAYNFAAFASPNFPPLAQVGVKVDLASQLLLPKPKKPLEVIKVSLHSIGDFWLFPGCDIKALEHLIDTPLKALILATYGTGNAPNLDPNFLKVLKKAHANKILIINTTQCLKGNIDESIYSTGRALEEAGAISAGNMTPEAIHAKLIYILSVTANLKQAEKMFTTNLCGEL